MAKYVTEYDAEREAGVKPEETFTLEEILLEFSEDAPESPPPEKPSDKADVRGPAEAADVHAAEVRVQTREPEADIPVREPARKKTRRDKKRERIEEARASLESAPTVKMAPPPPGAQSADEDSPTITMHPAQIREELAAEEELQGITPQKAAKRYGKMLPGLRVRVFAAAVICIATGYLNIAGDYGLFLPGMLGQSEAPRVWIVLVLQVVCGIVALDTLLSGVRGIFRLRIQLETVALVAYLSSLIHGGLYLTGSNDWGAPMGVVACFGLLALLVGQQVRCRGLRIACKAASASENPNFIVRSTTVWQKEALIKTTGDGRELVQQLERPDGGMRTWGLLSPLLIIAAVVLAVLICMREGSFHYIFRHLSALCCAAVSFGAPLVYAAPFTALSRRLSARAAALAGWQGVRHLGGRTDLIISDDDLYPPGNVSLNGMKVVGGFSAEKALSYTASVVSASGSGLSRSFTELMQSQGLRLGQVSELSFEEGGMHAMVNGSLVFVGSRDYLEEKGIHFTEEIRLDNAIYTAINDTLAAIFAVKYGSTKAAGEAMDMILSDGRLRPVLATRNPHLDPVFLSERLGVREDAMVYPALTDRLGLSESSQVPGAPAGVLCRRGLLPFAETVIGSRRLKKAVRWNTFFSVMGSVIAMLLMFYLGMTGAVAAGSATNLLIYEILWFFPTLLISGWVNRY